MSLSKVSCAGNARDLGNTDGIVWKEIDQSIEINIAQTQMK